MAAMGVEQPAAVTLSSKQRQSTVGANRKLMKAAICTPYSIVWPPVPKEDVLYILDLLKRELGSVELRKTSWIMRHNSRDNYKIFKRLKAAEKKEKLAELLNERSTEEKNLMSQMVVGFQNVSKHLERDELRLVVAERESWLLVQHLVLLLGVRGCPGLAIGGLQKFVADTLGVTKLSVLAFKKKQPRDSERFDKLIAEIVARCPPIHIPWLDLESELLDVKSGSSSNVNDTSPTGDTQNIDSLGVKVDASGPDVLSSEAIAESDTRNKEFLTKDIPNVENKDKTEQLDFIPISEIQPEMCKRKRKDKQIAYKGSKKCKKDKDSNWQSLSVGKMVGNPQRKSNKKK